MIPVSRSGHNRPQGTFFDGASVPQYCGKVLRFAPRPLDGEKLDRAQMVDGGPRDAGYLTRTDTVFE